jgi:riboflavin synthase
VFTGLVQDVGRVRATHADESSVRLSIATRLAARDRTVGASVAVAGVCLTVTAEDPDGFEAVVAFETLARTTLRRLGVDAHVNLEPALRVGEPLGGHLLSGHVDAVATLESARARGDARECWITIPRALARLVAPKGSVGLDGVSLTVNEVRDGGFSVGLVPHTLAVTTLGACRVGDPLNFEVDLVARYVVRWLETDPGVGRREEASAR